MAVLTYNTMKGRSSVLFSTSPALVTFHLFENNPSSRYKVMAHCGFHLHFSESSVEDLYVFLWEMSIQIPCPLLIGLFVLLLNTEFHVYSPYKKYWWNSSKSLHITLILYRYPYINIYIFLHICMKFLFWMRNICSSSFLRISQLWKCSNFF